MANCGILMPEIRFPLKNVPQPFPIQGGFRANTYGSFSPNHICSLASRESDKPHLSGFHQCSPFSASSFSASIIASGVYILGSHNSLL